jgi:hypothetical protein
MSAQPTIAANVKECLPHMEVTRTSRGRLRELIPRFTRAPSLPLSNSAAQVPGVLKLLFPNAISPKDSTEKVNVFRLRTCLDHVKEDN